MSVTFFNMRRRQAAARATEAAEQPDSKPIENSGQEIRRNRGKGKENSKSL